MRNKNEFEAQLKSAVQKACDQDAVLLEQEMEKFTYSFSPEFEPRMNDLLMSSKSRKVKRDHSWRYAMIAAAILLMNAMIVIANDEIRSKLGDLIITIYDECIEFKSIILGENKKEKFEKYSLQYLPDGYQRTQEKYNDQVEWFVEYRNDSGKVLLYSQSDSEAADILVSYDGTLTDEMIIRENTAWIVSDQEYITILFETDGYTFMVSAQESINEVVKMAESISVWEQ